MTEPGYESLPLYTPGVSIQAFLTVEYMTIIKLYHPFLRKDIKYPARNNVLVTDYVSQRLPQHIQEVKLNSPHESELD